MAIELDVIALGALLGYTEAQTSSIRDIRITGANHEIVVTRFVQDPGSPEIKKVLVGFPASDPSAGRALVVDDIFSFHPKSSSGPREYAKLSKAAIRALAERQTGQYMPFFV